MEITPYTVVGQFSVLLCQYITVSISVHIMTYCVTPYKWHDTLLTCMNTHARLKVLIAMRIFARPPNRKYFGKTPI